MGSVHNYPSALYVRPHSGQEYVIISLPFSLFFTAERIQCPHVGHFWSVISLFFMNYHLFPREANRTCCKILPIAGFSIRMNIQVFPPVK